MKKENFEKAQILNTKIEMMLENIEKLEEVKANPNGFVIKFFSKGAKDTFFLKREVEDELKGEFVQKCIATSVRKLGEMEKEFSEL